MTKSQTKTKSNIKNKKVCPLKIAALVLGVVTIGLGAGLIFCMTKMKSADEEEYLAAYEHVLRSYVNSRCENMRGDILKNPEDWSEDLQYKENICEVIDYGVSKDGDPFVTYTRDVYDVREHEKVEDTATETIYFQHPDEDWKGYSEALGIGKAPKR